MTRSCIYIVANQKSQRDCLNLIYSIRASGCTLDINLIHFGGKPIAQNKLPCDVSILQESDFPSEAFDFVELLQSILACPRGFLLRFLAFFGEYEQFIYTDNDIVALIDWTQLVDKLEYYDLVHADQEFTTGGKYNFSNPSVPELEFGPNFHLCAITAGHFAAKKSHHFLDSLHDAMTWMKSNQSACLMHDQTLMHLAVVIGNLKVLNLCKPPHSWLSSWAGDYSNSLEVIHLLHKGYHISHLHYSGGPTGLFERPIDELLLSSLSPKSRQHQLILSSLFSSLGFTKLSYLASRFKHKTTSALSLFQGG